MSAWLESARCLPEDGFRGTLIGRAWVPAEAGPSVVVVEQNGVFDISRVAPTVAGLLNTDDPLTLVKNAPRDRRLGGVDDLLANSAVEKRDPASPWLLAPVDLQAVKACGVTFAASLLERVVEEQCRGEPQRAAEVRADLASQIGVNLADVRPGSEAAAQLKSVLQAQGLWSQYLEVGLGHDAEVFTKTQPMSSVGVGADIGLHPESSWNNPEPEVVAVVNSRGDVVGATLGNDVNLRDFEGRSALLLGKAKDNNGSSAIGPFIRLFDASFGVEDVRTAELDLEVRGKDGFVLQGASSMREISRDVLDLVTQTIGPHHQYPDGFALFLGTLFAPTQDRDEPGQGFTHKLEDIVTIRSSKLGALVNRVNRSDRATPWDFGVLALMRNLSHRGLLTSRG